MEIIKFAIRIIIAIFWLWIALHDGKSIKNKDLTKDEKQYINILQWIAFVFPAFVFIALGLIE
jgi:hypothetical protein